jgi:hypothetical protein
VVKRHLEKYFAETIHKMDITPPPLILSERVNEGRGISMLSGERKSGKGIKLVRRKAYPTEEQVEKLHTSIALCNKLCVSFWAQVTMRDTFKPLRKRLMSILNRAYGAEEFATVSVNPLKFMAKRVERKATVGNKAAPLVGGLPFYGNTPDVYPSKASLRFPMLGEIRVDPVGVEGSPKYMYLHERKDGSWVVSLLIDDNGQRRKDMLLARRRRRKPCIGDVMW